MTVSVKANCPICGDQALDIKDIKLAIAQPAQARSRSFYQFMCKTCGEEVTKHATDRIIDDLSKGGVTTLTWTVPAEAYEGRPEGLPLVWDDVLDFRLAIANLHALALQADPSKEYRL